ncbi:HPP family protein [Micromonospora sp. CA-240977]
MLLKASHPPAGATTLIVSLGLAAEGERDGGPDRRPVG